MRNLDADGRPVIYHETQVKALCALHALNNVLQEKKFAKEDLDEICNELDPGSWLNSHKSVLGIGNYDVNVIMAALGRCDKEFIWFDKRKDAEDVLNLSNIYGFILNIRTELRYKSWFNLMKKHWIAIRSFEGNYYELDSKRAEGPELIGNEHDLFVHLRQQLDNLETELFVVLEKNIANCGSWKLNRSENLESCVEASTQRIGIEDGLKVIDLNECDARD